MGQPSQISVYLHQIYHNNPQLQICNGPRAQTVHYLFKRRNIYLKGMFPQADSTDARRFDCLRALLESTIRMSKNAHNRRYVCRGLNSPCHGTRNVFILGSVEPTQQASFMCSDPSRSLSLSTAVGNGLKLSTGKALAE